MVQQVCSYFLLNIVCLEACFLPSCLAVISAINCRLSRASIQRSIYLIKCQPSSELTIRLSRSQRKVRTVDICALTGKCELVTFMHILGSANWRDLCTHWEVRTVEFCTPLGSANWRYLCTHWEVRTVDFCTALGSANWRHLCTHWEVRTVDFYTPTGK